MIKVDDDADLRLLGPLVCGLQTGFGAVQETLKPKSNSSFGVFGTGTVGLATLMTAKMEGVDPLIAIDIHDNRIEIAKELGATHTINSSKENVQEKIDEITNGKGLDTSVDTTAVKEVMEQAIDVLNTGGVTSLLAETDNIVELDTTNLVIGSKNILGNLIGNTVPQIAVPQMIEAYNQEKFPFDKLVKFYRFDEINDAAEDSGSGETIKPIIIIDEEYRKDDPVEYKNN